MSTDSYVPVLWNRTTADWLSNDVEYVSPAAPVIPPATGIVPLMLNPRSRLRLSRD